jgi:hypothetical protein
MPFTLSVAYTDNQEAQLNFETNPPTADIGGQVYRIVLAKVLTASETAHCIELDDAFLHSTVSGFSTVHHFGVVLSFNFDTPLSIFGCDNITQLALIHSLQPMAPCGEGVLCRP